MRRTGTLVMSVFAAYALGVFTFQAFSQARAPQPRTQAEYGAYMAMFNEQDPVKKAAAGEKFIAEFKDSDFIPTSHRTIIGSYAKAQNWAKVMEAADRAAAIPGADDTLKAFAYGSGMMAAQNTNNIDKVISYGDKVLAIAPNDVDTMMAVSSAIPLKLPSDAAAKNAALDKAGTLAAKAITALQPLIAQAQAAQKPALLQAQGQLHATLGLVAFNRPDYKKSVEEYELSVKDSPKDDVARYYFGASYQALMNQATKEFQAAVKAENDAKAAKADQPTIDELAARRMGLQDEVFKNRDRAIEEFATAAAIAGPVAAQARTELTKLWTAKNENTNGLDAFISQKK